MLRRAQSDAQFQWQWLFVSASCVTFLLLGSMTFGDIKPSNQLDWWDLIGEGGAAGLAVIWMLLVLSSRPSGRVTSVLVSGLLAIVISMVQDFLDEVFLLEAALWESWLESVAMPAGLLVLTWGLWLLRQEQLVVRRQLRKRERIFRHHTWVDGLTQVPMLPYLKDQIALEKHFKDRPCALLLLDFDEFGQFNRQYGQAEGDRLLMNFVEFVILNLREDDLVCRYAGDRFAVLLPNTTLEQAEAIGQDLQNALANAVFYSRQGHRIQCRLSVGTASCVPASASMVEQASEALQVAKSRAEEHRFAHS